MSKLLCLTAAASATSSAVSSDAASAAAAQASKMDFTAVFLIISLIVAVALPVCILLFGKIKSKGSFTMTFWAMAGYIVFYVILSALLANLILRGYSDQNATYFEGTIFIVIQIICLEAGRFLLMFLKRKKHGTWGDALMLSGGYCLCDTIVIAVFFLVPYLIIVLSPNGGQIDGIFREMRVYVKDSNLVTGKEWRFIIKALTSLVFCSMQLCSTILMHICIAKKEKWMIILPFIIDALIMIPNRLSSFDVWYFGKNYVILPYLAVMAIAICLFTLAIYKNVYKRKEEVFDTSYFDKLTEK